MVPELSQVEGGIRVVGTWCPDNEANMPERFDRVYPVHAVEDAIACVADNGPMEYGTCSEAICKILDEWYEDKDEE